MELTTLITSAVSGGIKTINTGFVEAVTPTDGTGEDLNYYDVTIPSVVVAKSVPIVVGGLRAQFSSNASYLIANNEFARVVSLGSSPTGAASFILSCRLLNSTTLRVSCRASLSTGVASKAMSFRWTVLESN